MKRTIHGLLRIGLMLFLIIKVISNWAPFPANGQSGSAGYSFGYYLGIVFCFYMVASFFIHYANHAITDLMGRTYKKIPYITVAGMVFAIILLGICAFNLVKSLINYGADIYILVFGVPLVTLLYFTVIDLKALAGNPEAKE